MSQKSRKYKKVDAFLSKVRPAAPDSPLPAGVKPARSAAEDSHPYPVVHAAALPPAGRRQEGTPLSPSENTLCIPLMVSGTTIGAIQADGNEAGWTAQEIEIVSAVAAQLAQHLETLRLLKR